MRVIRIPEASSSPVWMQECRWKSSSTRASGIFLCCRLAGNVVDPDVIASLEFACLIKQAKLIVVMGHTDCGAVKGAIDFNRGILNPPGNKLKSLLLEIMPAVHEADKIFKGEQTSSNEQYVDLVCKFNINLNIRIILDNSPMLGDLAKKGELLITGAIYDLATGKVNFEAG